MKVKIGSYPTFVGPYQIAEKILFWRDKYEDNSVHEFGTWLHDKKNGDPTILARVCNWIHSKQKRKIKVKIHNYDVWSMDSTLAPIILPMLILLNKNKHGAPFVEDEDVPEELRSTSAPAKENEWDTDTNHFKRWDWVINEMIWTFEQLQPDCDWEDQYHTGVIDLQWKEQENGFSQMYHGPLDTHVFDSVGYTAHNERITKGTTLFGKYFRALWD